MICIEAKQLQHVNSFSDVPIEINIAFDFVICPIVMSKLSKLCIWSHEWYFHGGDRIDNQIFFCFFFLFTKFFINYLQSVSISLQKNYVWITYLWMKCWKMETTESPSTWARDTVTRVNPFSIVIPPLFYSSKQNKVWEQKKMSDLIT